MPIESCVETIAETLPVCSVRKVAYSTFSIISVTDNEIAELIQFDNPEIIVLRGGVRYDYPMTTRQIAGKTIHESRFPVEENDVFIAMSDGATYAGVGPRAQPRLAARKHHRFRGGQLSAGQFRQVHRGQHRGRVQPPV